MYHCAQLGVTRSTRRFAVGPGQLPAWKGWSKLRGE